MLKTKSQIATSSGEVLAMSTETGAPTPKRRRRRPTAGLVAVTAFWAIYLLLFVWPLLTVGLRSLSASGQSSYSFADFSLIHFRKILSEAALRDVVVNTLTISGTATMVTLLLAFPTAYLMSRLNRAMSTVLLLLVLLPFWVSILVRLFAFVELLAADGPVNHLLDATGAGRQDLLFTTTGTVIGTVNYLLPYMILLLFAAMSGVDPNLTRAAKSLGCSQWQTFWRVYLPLIRGSVVGALVLTFIIASGFFLTPALLGGPGDVTIATFIAQQVQNYQWGAASAFGVILMAVTLIGFMAAGRLTGLTSGDVFTASAKGVSRADPMAFGPAKIALSFIAITVVGFLFVPIFFVFPLSWGTDSTIVWPPRGFTWSWYNEALSDPVWAAALRKSLSVALAVAALSLGTAVFLARWVRSLAPTSPARSLIVGLIYLPAVSPVILLGIGTLDVQGRLGLLGSWWGLVLVQTILALPFTYLVVAAALANVDPTLERAAWTMGASRLRAWRKVILPTVIPALAGAGLLAFISAWDEAVVALFQTGFEKTLPVNFYASVKSGASPVIAAIGVMLMLSIVALGLAVLLVRFLGHPFRLLLSRTIPTRHDKSN